MALAVSNPGIFWVNSGVITPDVLSYSDFVRWYENIHIPDWMGAKKGAITTAWRYECLDVGRALPFLVTYKYPEISANNAPEFRNVTLNSPLLPEGGPVNKFAQFSVMSGPHIETWRAGSAGDGTASSSRLLLATAETDLDTDRGPLMLSEAIDPPAGMTDAAFHEWYRETHINEVSQLEGWRRTSRFENKMGSPRWFAIHEYEEYGFYDTNKSAPVTALLGSSDKTKEIQKSARKLDMAFWNLTRAYGEETVPWGALSEEKIL